MKWSWSLGKIAGIELKVHATFFLLVAWVGWTHWADGESLAAAIAGITFILSLFACVVLHELGHALTARRYGIRTRDIVLLPIGGVARLERIPEDPRQELWVAVAGPAVNVVIATVLFTIISLTGSWQPVGGLTVSGGSFLERIAIANVILVIFNLIPAFPMDGGRMLRAVLAMRLEYVKATQIAATVGQGLAFVFALIGLWAAPFLLFIAFFVWIGASQEASMVQIKHALGGIPVGRVMITEFVTLHPEEPLTRAIALTLAGSQKDFPVVVGDRVVGVLTQSTLMRALAEKGEHAQTASVMEQSFELADVSEMIEPVFIRLRARRCSTLPVLEAGRLVGLLTLENVGEFLSLQSAMR